MGGGRYDGANRNDYFQGVSIAPAGAVAVTGLGTALHSLAGAGRACPTCALFMAKSGTPDFARGEGLRYPDRLLAPPGPHRAEGKRAWSMVD
jgi:hypothetical protein